MFELPVVKDEPATLPMATLSPPVVIAYKAFEPTAVLP